MLKQGLQQKLQQKLSPSQIQVIKILEIPTLEMEERIRQEVEENPALEVDFDKDEQSLDNETTDEDSQYNSEEEFDFQDYLNDEDDIPDYKLIANNKSKDEKYQHIPFTVSSTLREYLLEQIGLLSLNQEDTELAEYIIDNIDEEGYIRRDSEAIADDLIFQSNIETTEEEIEKLIGIIQKLEPAGIGARDLQECLYLQLQRKDKTKEIELAIKIIEEYFEEFSRKHYSSIIRGLKITDDELKLLIDEITKLNPKPGSSFGGTKLEDTLSTIIPDFLVENNNGNLTVSLNNSNVPYLRINASYNNMIEDYIGNKKNQSKEMKDAVTFAKQKIDNARWFIDAIRQRQRTLLATMSAIVNFQREFFLEGDETFLRPMVLKDIADITGYDISTISRVSNSKYVQTSFGVFQIKYFFSESLIKHSGEEISTHEIKKIMLECIEEEDKQNPMSDERLVKKLKEKGYKIARRTVAKYREQLNIPVARLRKSI